MASPPRIFHPVPGINVVMADRQVSITGRAEVFGDSADAAVAAKLQSVINNTWTKTFPYGGSVSCAITVTYRAPGSAKSAVLQIEHGKGRTDSDVHAAKFGFGDEMIWLNANDPNALRWVAAHEFGHILGLEDKYIESFTSRVKGALGFERDETKPMKGYEYNMMGSGGFNLTIKNIVDLEKESKASEWWLNDDDQVRAWVAAHGAAEIASLRAATMIEALRILMGGWISDADVVAMVTIIEAVRDPATAGAIRAAINPMDMKSLGQRDRVRIALDKMPR